MTAAVPSPGSRGPRRPITAPAETVARLLQEARHASTLVEYHRQLMLAAAVHRQSAIAELHSAGLSVRQLAGALKVSPAVIQSALRPRR